MTTPRSIVKAALNFTSPERVPRDLWLLPIAADLYPETIEYLGENFPSDFTSPDYYYPPSYKAKGDPYRQGIYIDEWGCEFVNIRDGIIGEVRTPLLSEISDWNMIKPPYEQLPAGGMKQKAYDHIARYYDHTDLFVKANICPRPWERYQFIRGSQNSYLDILFPDQGFKQLLKKINDFYLQEMEMWAKSKVDAISFMDDWGAQNSLLIDPEMWRYYFKPVYKQYCEMAHAEGKFVFMHSDGYIQDIMADLIEIGVDALNSQLFCMDLDKVAEIAKGKITFWGEIDRQHILPDKDPDTGVMAVKQIVDKLYLPTGGIIAQLEFGAGANPETVKAVYREWDKY